MVQCCGINIISYKHKSRFKMEKGFKNKEEQPQIMVVRHLKDVNDLQNNRDSNLEPNQENVAEQIADEIIEDFSKTDNKIIFISVSDKRRALETAEMVAIRIRQRTEARVVVNSNGDLADLNHGEYILPGDYQVNDFYQPFENAWKIFTQETFEKHNIDYKFGDSKGGEYESIKNIWTRLGESYREIFLRLLKSIIDLAENQNRFNEAGIKPYIITHSLPFGVFRSLYGLSQDVKFNNLEIAKGNLIFECWKYYNSGKLQRSSYGQIHEFPMEIMQNQKFLDIIRDEFNFLSQNEK